MTKRQKIIFNFLKDLYNIASEIEFNNFTGKIREIDEKVRKILEKGLSFKNVKLAIKHSRLSLTQLNIGRDNLLLGTRRSKRLNLFKRPLTPAA
jgi:hypothetical protein